MSLTRANGLISHNVGRGNADMFQCHVCGSTEANQERVSEVFMIEGKRVLVENIPASVCARCGEATFSRETTERIRRMLHGEAKPVRAEMLEVFSYA
jgi:HTH-type transcriptional regulator / antitoxin MqsA